MKSCEKCGRPIADTAACPYCGYSQAAELPNALQPGWEIAGRYRIESVIGLGGFCRRGLGRFSIGRFRATSHSQQERRGKR